MFQHTAYIQKPVKKKKVFISYSHQDEQLKNLLMLTFRTLESEGYIHMWHDRMIIAGQKWDDTIRHHLESSELVLFLVSEAFLQSGYCRDVEMKTALSLSQQNLACVIPIILSKCTWHKEPFSNLLALPTDGQPLFKASGAPHTHRLQQTIEGLKVALLGLWNDKPVDDPFGATVNTFSIPTSTTDETDSIPYIDILKPSKPLSPVLLKGLKISLNGNTINFLVDSGKTGYAVHSPEFDSERDKVIDYFWESLGVAGEHQWVNLSPHDSSRMLPEALSGTRLGHDMLVFDLKLKELSASLLHPDSESGRCYWNELFLRAKSKFGTTNLPFRAFHNITVSALTAKVFEPPQSWLPEANNQQLRDFLSEPYHKAAFVVDYKLKAECNTDEKATSFMHLDVSRSGKFESVTCELASLSTSVFRDLILPIVEQELNEGENFAFNRQYFVSTILAYWLEMLSKKDSLVGGKLSWYIGKNKPDAAKFPASTITALTASGLGTTKLINNRFGYLGADDPAFRVPENVTFYEKYIQLFRRGLYRVVRTEGSGSQEQMTGRVYFSGAVDLTVKPLSITERMEGQ